MQWLTLIPLLTTAATARSLLPTNTHFINSTCTTTLTSDFEFPHLIIPINASSPSTAPGTSYNGHISREISSLYNFDIPNDKEEKDLDMCSLVFHFPSAKQRPSEYYTFSGDGRVRFGKLERPATEETSFKNAPRVQRDYGVTTLQPGNVYGIADFECPFGDRIGFKLENAGSTVLNHFQDYSQPPFGLFITRCKKP